MDEQDEGMEVPMNLPVKTSRRTVSLTTLPAVLAMFLTAAPFASPAAQAQTLREAGKAAAQAKSCEAKAQEWVKECEAEEEEEAWGLDRSGLGWTGIGLASAGGGMLVTALTVKRWRHCGPNDRNTCRSAERVYGISGGTLLTTGLSFIVIDEIRRARERDRLPKRQMAIAIGPSAVQVRLSF